MAFFCEHERNSSGAIDADLMVSPSNTPFMDYQDFSPSSTILPLAHKYACSVVHSQLVISPTKLAETMNALWLLTATEQRLESVSWVFIGV